jgi:hypothetical protein
MLTVLAREIKCIFIFSIWANTALSVHWVWNFRILADCTVTGEVLTLSTLITAWNTKLVISIIIGLR